MCETLSPDWFDRLLTRHRVRRVAMTIAVVALATLALSYLVAKSGRTPLGTTLAADYPQFFVAGQILTHPGPDRLYDLQLQSRLQLKLFPGETRALPFAYPPLVAYVLKPLSNLPYAQAAAIYTLFVALLYGIGLFALWNTCPAIGMTEKSIAIWICLAFEPFAFECLHGGQVSTFAFACVSIALWLDQKHRPILSGIAIGLLAYKPPLLAILLPMLLLGRRWKMLASCVATIAVGGLLSLWFAGPIACREFIRMIGTYGNAVAANDGFKTWKYVDLSAFLRLLHAPREVSLLVPLAAMAIAGVFLGWIQRPNVDWPARAAIWSLALAATLIFNLYVAIYDTVLIVPALWLAADLCYRRTGELTPGFRRLATIVFIAPWLSPAFAIAIGLQIDTLVIAAAIAWIALTFLPDLLRDHRAHVSLKSTDPESISIAPSPHH